MECDNSSVFTNTKEQTDLQNNLQKYLQQQIKAQKIDFASVYFRDLNNGPWFGINDAELFSPSSLIKIPLMITYLKLAESDPSLLQKELLNTQAYNPDIQNFPPDVTLVPNQKYTIEELIRRMIVYSDNLAYDLLNHQIDAQTILKVYNDLGVDISPANSDPDGNIISVKAYGSFFRILYNSSYLNRDMSEKALKLLSLSKFTQGIVAGVAKNITVAHKFGERQYLATGQKQFHDCGIVYLPHQPYLICIMTRGHNFENLIHTIRDISSQIYTSLSSQL